VRIATTRRPRATLQVLAGEDEMPNGRSRRRLWCRDYERVQ
jgi:hypothetical protein